MIWPYLILNDLSEEGMDIHDLENPYYEATKIFYHKTEIYVLNVYVILTKLTNIS